MVILIKLTWIQLDERLTKFANFPTNTIPHVWFCNQNGSTSFPIPDLPSERFLLATPISYERLVEYLLELTISILILSYPLEFIDSTSDIHYLEQILIQPEGSR